jgi:hypothetical protein
VDEFECTETMKNESGMFTKELGRDTFELHRRVVMGEPQERPG